jgi:hypothetical protein
MPPKSRFKRRAKMIVEAVYSITIVLFLCWIAGLGFLIISPSQRFAGIPAWEYAVFLFGLVLSLSLLVWRLEHGQRRRVEH